ncbi:hypothetical protein BMON_1558 [Bifidobacterium mongoliense DSM 21395]|uniref:Uncharacterized protein n=1 Tax=Bifidobacterium mongoliense DSM 21395 TaxID=1437603 RepID=A0A087C4U3_9BIFI|nr:hypothetical protein BMON_1558 [Bifidobacterium mongoliense DSM 21395]
MDIVQALNVSHAYDMRKVARFESLAPSPSGDPGPTYDIALMEQPRMKDTSCSICLTPPCSAPAVNGPDAGTSRQVHRRHARNATTAMTANAPTTQQIPIFTPRRMPIPL